VVLFFQIAGLLRQEPTLLLLVGVVAVVIKGALLIILELMAIYLRFAPASPTAVAAVAVIKVVQGVMDFRVALAVAEQGTMGVVMAVPQPMDRVMRGAMGQVLGITVVVVVVQTRQVAMQAERLELAALDWPIL
jgi:hypothetical protein